MYVFMSTRVPRPGREPALADWGVEMAQVGSEAAGVELTAYRTFFAGQGGSGGSVAITGTFDDFAALGRAMDAVRAAPRHRELVRKAGKLSVGPTVSRFLEVVAGTPAAGALITFDSGLARLDRMPKAVEFGTKMRDIIAQKSQQDTVFAADMYGTLGQMAWITPADDFAMLDAQGKAIMGDPQYLQMMTEAPNVFDAPSFDRALAQRLGDS